VVGIDAVLTVIFLVQGAGGGVIGLALDAFVIWTLVNKKDLFALVAAPAARHRPDAGVGQQCCSLRSKQR
jgi:hypothetical protein